MRLLIKARRAGVLTLAAAGGVLLVAGPAAADVSVTPATAVQGSGENLTFHVTNPAQSAMTRVQLVLPADTPVAEVYPLSADDWAPQITQQTLTTPLETIHGGSPVTQTAKDITWIAMPGKAIAPGRSADLSVALGPLPTLSEMQFTVVATYADGKAAAPMPPVILKLTPAAPGDPAAAHAGHAGTPTDGTDTAAPDPEAPYFAQTVNEAEQGPGFWSIAGWIMAGLGGIGAIVAVLRRRRKADPVEAPDETTADEAPNTAKKNTAKKNTAKKNTAGEGAAGKKAADQGLADEATVPDEAQEPVSAGAGKAVRVTAWSYRDGPD